MEAERLLIRNPRVVRRAGDAIWWLLMVKGSYALACHASSPLQKKSGPSRRECAKKETTIILNKNSREKFIYIYRSYDGRCVKRTLNASITKADERLFGFLAHKNAKRAARNPFERHSSFAPEEGDWIPRIKLKWRGQICLCCKRLMGNSLDVDCTQQSCWL